MREAETAFGDGRLNMERFADKARHVEVQVVGDGEGNVIHLEGHALEARINAENAERDFMPAPGHLTAWAPPERPEIRLDGHMRAGRYGRTRR